MTTECAAKAVAKVHAITGIAIHVVNLTSYPQRAKASWNHGAP